MRPRRVTANNVTTIGGRSRNYYIREAGAFVGALKELGETKTSKQQEGYGERVSVFHGMGLQLEIYSKNV